MQDDQQLYLSFKWKDGSALGTYLYQQLQNDRYTVWQADVWLNSSNYSNHPSAMWQESVRQMLQSRAVIALLTPATLADTYSGVWTEIMMGQGLKLPVIIATAYGATVPSHLAQLPSVNLTDFTTGYATLRHLI